MIDTGRFVKSSNTQNNVFILHDILPKYISYVFYHGEAILK